MMLSVVRPSGLFSGTLARWGVARRLPVCERYIYGFQAHTDFRWKRLQRQQWHALNLRWSVWLVGSSIADMS